MDGSLIAAWVEAIGTAGAFTLAAWIYFLSFLDRRGDQARHVAAWVEANGAQRYLRLFNSSTEPVFNLWVEPVPGFGQAEPITTATLPPSERPRDLSPAGDDVGGPGYRLPFPVDIAFTDAAGREWHRLGRSHRLQRCRRHHKHGWVHHQRDK